MKYRQYLRSEKWKKKKEQFAGYNGGKECWVCGSKERLNVHHLTYKHAQDAHFRTELRYLCQPHHYEVHEIIKAKGWGKDIWRGTFYVRAQWEKEHGKRWGKRDIMEYFRNSKKLQRRSL